MPTINKSERFLSPPTDAGVVFAVMRARGLSERSMTLWVARAGRYVERENIALENNVVIVGC